MTILSLKFYVTAIITSKTYNKYSESIYTNDTVTNVYNSILNSIQN